MSFSQVRTQALLLEKQAELLLTKYSKFQTEAGESMGELAEEGALRLQIDDLLRKRDDVVTRLAHIGDQEQILTSKIQQLTRHREVLADHRRHFARIEANLRDTRNRNNLMFSVHLGLEAHRQRNQQDRDGLNAADYSLDERGRVDNANSLADRLLELAYQTRDELWSQRQYLQNAQQKMFGTLGSIPGISTLISKINTRRKRDTIILALVIAVCILFLVWI